eukprot:6204688-Alexandrium_andersonii.AAC.1
MLVLFGRRPAELVERVQRGLLVHLLVAALALVVELLHDGVRDAHRLLLHGLALALLGLLLADPVEHVPRVG